MSDSDRGRVDKALIGSIVAAILVIGLYWAMFYDAGYQSGRHQERAQIERKHYAANTGERVERECAGKATKAFRECATEIVASEHENKRNESDLAAQWQAADWVLWAAIIAGAQLIATVIGLYFIKGTLDATLKAVEDTGKATNAMLEANKIATGVYNLTKRNADLEMRAWIVFEQSEAVVNTASLRIRLGFNNIGKLPAFVTVSQFALNEIPIASDDIPADLIVSGDIGGSAICPPHLPFFSGARSVTGQFFENVIKGTSAVAIRYVVTYKINAADTEFVESMGVLAIFLDGHDANGRPCFRPRSLGNESRMT